MEFKFDCVNQAFFELVKGFQTGDIPTVRKDSRNGPVMMIPEPVTICFRNPRNRVLFNRERDANPFFHLYEAFWMLAGRNDVDSLKYYASKIGDYSDDGKTFNGAYGYRWRNAKGATKFGLDTEQEYPVLTDQLKIIIKRLKEKPDDRRCVLQMWNVEDDLLKIGTSLDVCCNVSVFFSIRREFEGMAAGPNHPTLSPGTSLEKRYLDMTVTNRSNDMIWGLLGANVVHFSYLLEYMAEQIGVQVGHQYHFTNNLHVYTDTNSGWKPEQWLKVGEIVYYRDTILPTQLGIVDDEDLKNIVSDKERTYRLRNDYLLETVLPALQAFSCHKLRDYRSALQYCSEIDSPDWKIACTEWIERRQLNWRKKGEKGHGFDN